MTDNHFDPHQVPPFPVYTIRQTADGADTLDGIPIEPAHGETRRERAATDAAAHKAEREGYEAVRVRAHLLDGRQVDMVVRTNGEVYDTTVPEAPEPPSRRKRGIIITAAGLSSALVLGGGAFFLGHALSADSPEPVAATPTPPPGAGTKIPVGLPAAFAPEAAWMVPVDDRAGARHLTDGRILTATADRTLAILDADTGHTQWTGANAPTDLSTVQETTWQGQRVLATATSQTLTLWPLEGTDLHVSPVSVDLDATAEVSYAGTAPLIDLGDYTVLAPATPTQDTHRVTLPPGAVPAAIADGLIRSLTDAAAWTTDPQTGEHQRIDYSRPEGTEGSPKTVIGLDANHALAQWPQEDNPDDVVALIDLTTGTVTATHTVSRPLTDNDEIITDEAAHTAVIGNLFVSYATAPILRELDGFKTTAIDDTLLYGTTEGKAATAAVTSDGLSVEDYPLYSPEDPSPALVTANAAYIVHTSVDQTHLYRADRTPSKESTP